MKLIVIIRILQILRDWEGDRVRVRGFLHDAAADRQAAGAHGVPRGRVRL